MAGLRLGLGLGLGARRAPGPSGPTGIVLSHAEIDDDAAVGAVVGTLFMVGGTEPASFTLTSNPDDLWQIAGAQLQVAASLAGRGNTEESPMVRVTDALGFEFEAVLPITIAETAGENDSGIGAGDGDIETPDEEDPEFDGGGFEADPIQQDTAQGLRIVGKNGGSATFLKDWGTAAAGGVYTMRYVADWSQMTRQGRQAAVGFAFRSANDFHLVALRGDGGNPATMRASRIFGDFRKSNQFTVTDDGAAANGSKDGPNWLQLEIAEAGDTYTLRSSADGETWADEYTDTLPAPLDAATDALQFGPGGYFTNQDKGVFSVTITSWSAGAQGAVVEYLGEITSGSNVDIGAAADDALIVVCPVAIRSSSESRAITSVTINSEAASLHVQTPSNSTTSATVGIASLLVTTGGSIPISWTTAGGVILNVAHVLKITGLPLGSVVDFAAAVSNDPTLTLDLGAAGVLVVISANRSANDFTLYGAETVDADVHENILGTNCGRALAHTTPTSETTDHGATVTSDAAAESVAAVAFG